MQTWPGRPYPLGATFDGSGTNFALYSSVAQRVELCLPRRRRHRATHRGDRDRRARLARVPARRQPGHAVRVPRARAVRPGVGPPVQPGEAPAGPVREGGGRRPRRRPVAVLLLVRRRGADHDGHHAGVVRLAGPHHGLRGGQPVLRLGPRPPAGHAVPRDGDLRGARQGPHDAPPRRPRRAARHVRGTRAPGGDRAPDQAGRHGDRADAGAPVRHRPVARAPRA